MAMLMDDVEYRAWQVAAYPTPDMMADLLAFISFNARRIAEESQRNPEGMNAVATFDYANDVAESQGQSQDHLGVSQAEVVTTFDVLPEEPAELAGEKQCLGCGQVLPLSSFTRDRAKSDGRVSRCVPCMREYRKDLRQRNAERAARPAEAREEEEEKGS
jgi:hypothetical protein